MKKLKSILIMSAIMIWITGISYGATNSYQVEMKPEKKDYLVGETIKVPVKVKNIDMEEGIVAYSTLLFYDEDILEKPEIKEAKNWGKPNVLEHWIQGTTLSMQPIKDDQEIVTLTFKIKKEAKLGQTTISLTKFEASDGENTIVNDGSTLEINISNAQAQVTDVILDNVWFNQKNIIITSIISIVTLLIIILITIYYIQHREKKQENKILYEEVSGILEEDKKQEDKEEETKKPND